MLYYQSNRLLLFVLFLLFCVLVGPSVRADSCSITLPTVTYSTSASDSVGCLLRGSLTNQFEVANLSYTIKAVPTYYDINHNVVSAERHIKIPLQLGFELVPIQPEF